MEGQEGGGKERKKEGRKSRAHNRVRVLHRFILSLHHQRPLGSQSRRESSRVGMGLDVEVLVGCQRRTRTKEEGKQKVKVSFSFLPSLIRLDSHEHSHSAGSSCPHCSQTMTSASPGRSRRVEQVGQKRRDPIRRALVGAMIAEEERFSGWSERKVVLEVSRGEEVAWRIRGLGGS